MTTKEYRDRMLSGIAKGFECECIPGYVTTINGKPHVAGYGIISPDLDGVSGPSDNLILLVEVEKPCTASIGNSVPHENWDIPVVYISESPTETDLGEFVNALLASKLSHI